MDPYDEQDSDTDSDSDSGVSNDDLESEINPEGFFNHDLIDHLLDMKLLKQKLDHIGNKNKDEHTDQDYLIQFYETLEASTENPIFKNLLEFFDIQKCEDGPIRGSWKIPLNWNYQEMSKLIADLIECNIQTKKHLFFNFNLPVEVLKKLKAFFNQAKDEVSGNALTLFPIENISGNLKKLLLCLELELKGDGSWILPKTLYDSFQKKIDFVQNLIQFNTNFNDCKVCNEYFQSVLKHLVMKPECMNAYSEEEIFDIKMATKARTKNKEKEWKRRHKSEISAQNAKRYKMNKEAISKKYQENKTEIRKKQFDYQEENYDKIAKTKAKYYQKNKEKYAQNYLERKELKAEQKKIDKENQLLEKEKNYFNLCLKPRIQRHKKNFEKPYLKMIETYMNRCKEFHVLQIPRLDEVQQRINEIYKLVDEKIVSTSKDIANCYNSHDAKEIWKQFERFWDPFETELEDHIYKTLKDISFIIEEKFECPQCNIVFDFKANCYKCSKK